MLSRALLVSLVAPCLVAAGERPVVSYRATACTNAQNEQVITDILGSTTSACVVLSEDPVAPTAAQQCACYTSIPADKFPACGAGDLNGGGSWAESRAACPRLKCVAGSPFCTDGECDITHALDATTRKCGVVNECGVNSCLDPATPCWGGCVNAKCAFSATSASSDVTCTCNEGFSKLDDLTHMKICVPTPSGSGDGSDDGSDDGSGYGFPDDGRGRRRLLELRGRTQHDQNQHRNRTRASGCPTGGCWKCTSKSSGLCLQNVEGATYQSDDACKNAVGPTGCDPSGKDPEKGPCQKICSTDPPKPDPCGKPSCPDPGCPKGNQPCRNGGECKVNGGYPGWSKTCTCKPPWHGVNCGQQPPAPKPPVPPAPAPETPEEKAEDAEKDAISMIEKYLHIQSKTLALVVLGGACLTVMCMLSIFVAGFRNKVRSKRRGAILNDEGGYDGGEDPLLNAIRRQDSRNRGKFDVPANPYSARTRHTNIDLPPPEIIRNKSQRQRAGGNSFAQHGEQQQQRPGKSRNSSRGGSGSSRKPGLRNDGVRDPYRALPIAGDAGRSSRGGSKARMNAFAY